MSFNATVHLPDGSFTTMPLDYADYYLKSQLQVAITFGVRLGASIVLSAILWMVARTYTSILFILYQLNLILMIIHAALNIQNLESPLWSMTWYFTGVTEVDDTGINCAMTASVLGWFLIISICATFVVQIHAAFADLSTAKRVGVLIASCVAAFPCVFVWGYYLITNAKIAGDVNDTGAIAFEGAQWAINGAWPVFAVTTTVFSAVLCAKLLVVVRTRARMGIEHFDPLRAVLVMTLQNSVIPAIFSIVCAALPNVHEANSLPSIAILLTVIFLPTGYIWAQYRSITGPSGSNGHTSTLATYLARSSSNNTSDVESDFSEMAVPNTASTFDSTKKAVDYVYQKSQA